jgi:hypothetical protein
MSTRFLHTVALVALAASCAFAQAQTPTRVGRISLTQGQVSIGGETGDETNAAVVNWPVTSRNQITTGRGARTEIKIGSTALRLDDDTALDVVELDDDSLRLHLHYGSVTVRVRNPDAVRGFEITTPEGRVHLQEAGRLRIDAGRRQDTTVVSVFDGVALLDGGGSRLTLRAGKRAEIVQDDVRTGLALRDSFDEWAMLRDERDDRSASVRYVTSEMTGYEDLDQNGSWRDDRDYGPVWFPRQTPLGWAPYRDGQWTYVQPWGWTWVDNAPWGYAPFHYGRWVMLNQRWCWAPGRNISRVVWSPALVGWVGGSNWSLSFNTRGTHHAAPAQGWYPLAPRDTYVPTYRVDQDKLRYINRHAGETHNGQRRDGDNQRLGLTVVPHEQFRQRGSVQVRGAPQVIASPTSLQGAPVAVAPAIPAAIRERGDDNRRAGAMAPDPRRFEREQGRGIARGERNERNERGDRVAVPATAGVVVVNPAAPVQAGAAPVSPAATLFRRDRDSGRPVNDDPRRPRMEPPSSMPTPAVLTVPAQAAVVVTQPPPAAVPQRDNRDNRFERGQRDPDVERERRPRGAESYQQQQPAPVSRPVPQMQVQQAPIQQQVQPQPQRMPAPQPAMVAQPQVQQQAAVVRQAPPPQAAAPAQAPAREKDTSRDNRRREDGERNERR